MDYKKKRNQSGLLVRVRGTVQGVGFRPHVFKLAQKFGINGYVLNDGDGVLIEAWGDDKELQSFVAAIDTQKPPLSTVISIEQNAIEGRSGALPQSFVIHTSVPTAVATNISADASTCAECLNDVKDPLNRRFRYPFTNCTNCGPRLSIARGIPYDRKSTSMSKFPMCQLCLTEYNDPTNRRFHAQANACHDCGPKARLERMDGKKIRTESLTQFDDVDAALTLIEAGEVLAIKGIGGYHLAVDACNEGAVSKLRKSKARMEKPFALMARDLNVIKEYCFVSEQEEKLLTSWQAPIVLLQTNGKSSVAPSISPGQNTLGFMLPYTAMHHLLLMRMDRPIVLTSGNLAEEPQCIDDADMKERLKGIADYTLIHDRDIVNRVDDSVVRQACGQVQILRRSRGYAPEPIVLPEGFASSKKVLALGGQLKNTFCLTKGDKAIVSQHLGDLDDARTLADYEYNLELYSNLFEHKPDLIIVDQHPDYQSTRLGERMARKDNVNLLSVQHHHAHIASVLAENCWPLEGGEVLGVALDGLGYGKDGDLWGGEFFRCDYRQFERLGTFKPVPLLGGAQAMRQPWRNTYAHLMAEMGWERFLGKYERLELARFFQTKPLKVLSGMLKSGENSPACSSAGRLFDAVCGAVGICREEISYEGQAAVQLETVADEASMQNVKDEDAYPFEIRSMGGSGLPYIEPIQMWHSLLNNLLEETPIPIVSARFHKGLANAIVDMVMKLIQVDGEQWTNTIALSGGVFQNKILLELVKISLQAEGLRVLVHARMPANDGGVSLGQAAIGLARVQPEGA